MTSTRRSFMTGIATGAGSACLGMSSVLEAQSPPGRQQQGQESDKADPFPQQDPKLVQEVVGASHGRIERVKELVATYPELAKSAWDWGFGDWETPIDAASHVGNREIALFLIEHGARPTHFTFAMLGQLDVLKAILTANPKLQKTAGPHGLSLFHHARVGGENAASVREYLESLGEHTIEVTPISQETIDSLLGKYEVVGSSGPKFEILTNRRGLAMRGAGGTPANLTLLPDGSFHPAGAVSVRLRFEVAGGKASAATLRMGDRVYSATRLP